MGKALLFGFFFIFNFSASAEVLIQTADSPAECQAILNYDSPQDRQFPSFILRAGYSRDNDDPAEGHYETAVFDLELIGRRLPDNRVCLFLLATTALSSEPQNAPGWAATFALRRAPSFSWDGSSKSWKKVSGFADSGEALTVITPRVPSYAQNEKLTKFDRPVNQRNGLQGLVFLGTYADGFHTGQVYFQKKDYRNTDDSNYDSVRHVLNWRVQLKEGILVNSDRPRLQAVNNQESAVNFWNEVGFVTPSWNGKVVAVAPGKYETKYHSVGLLWRDVYEPSQNGRIDLLALLQRLLRENPSYVAPETIGRMRAKPF